MTDYITARGLSVLKDTPVQISNDQEKTKGGMP